MRALGPGRQKKGLCGRQAGLRMRFKAFNGSGQSLL